MEVDGPRSEPHELTKLGLEVVFGGRGKAVAQYLDKRRIDRHRDRLSKLAIATVEAGVSNEELLNCIANDDDLQELFEKVATTATRSRYDEKITFLGKVLANASKRTDPVQLDTAWLRVRAVEDLEPMHIQLLWLIDIANRLWSSTTLRTLERVAESKGIDGAVIEAGIGLLRRHGLIDETTELELEVEVDIVEPDKGELPSDTTVDTSGSEVKITWELTALGAELLRELRNSQQEPG
ncbi:MAG: hypothetical protein QOD63_2876 [Actinomycetota bacterium]|jgi:hypothetical protein|nr:hypothetical protein [Actinomycetota bacterium]